MMNDTKIDAFTKYCAEQENKIGQGGRYYPVSEDDFNAGYQAALTHNPQWISVEDRLPDDNDFVLVHYAEFITTKELDWEWTDEYSRYVVAKYIEEFEQWCFEDSSGDLTELNAPSHWQPLPEPPKE